MPLRKSLAALRIAGAVAILALAAVGGGIYLARPPAVPLPEPKPPELGRPTDADVATPYVPAAVDTQAAQLTTEQALEFAQRYGEAMVAAFARAQSAQDRSTALAAGERSGQAFPRGSDPPALRTLPEIAAALTSGDATKLAEQRFGPGPLGDAITVAAVTPCKGCQTELVGSWNDPDPKRVPSPLANLDADTLYARGLTELAPGFDQFLNAEIAAGWSHLRSGARGRALRSTYLELGYGLGKKAFVAAGYRADLVLRHRKRD